MRFSLSALALLTLACAGPTAPPVSTHVEDWRDEVIYQIVVDRFANGDPSNDVVDGIGPEPDDLARFQGGDWQGIRDRLDYIEGLGVTTLWLSPPYRNVPRTEREDGYHGYWPADFVDANPRFGTIDDLRALVRDAHDRGMLVILDVVPNHAGRVFTYDLDADGEVDEVEVEPPFSDPPYDVPLLWSHRPTMLSPDGERFTLEAAHFHLHGASSGEPFEKEQGDFPTGLRDLDTESEAVIAALVETHARWVEVTDVDGFRIDAIPHAARPFWAAFCSRLRTRLAEAGKTRFFLLGEVFDANPEALASYTGLDQLDGAFAFDLKRDLIERVLLEGAPPTVARGSLETNRSVFPASPQPGGIELDPWRARVAFADNHDVFRLRGELNDPLAAHLALIAVLTVDAIPAVYYGTEQGLAGRVHHASREPLWPTGYDETHPTYRFLQRLVAVRRRSRALRYGSLEVRYASASGGADEDPGPDAGMIAWSREHDGERVLVVLNSALASSEARIPTRFGAGTRLVDALESTTDAWVVEADRSVVVRLPSRAGVLLEAR
ncbi:MAG: alpha-amylase family glycosyl hydrolase [Sandaracinaceae bacterium]